LAKLDCSLRLAGAAVEGGLSRLTGVIRFLRSRERVVTFDGALWQIPAARGASMSFNVQPGYAAQRSLAFEIYSARMGIAAREPQLARAPDRTGRPRVLRLRSVAAVLAALVGMMLGPARLRAGDEPGRVPGQRDAYLSLKKDAEAQLTLAEKSLPREPSKKEDIDRLNNALDAYRRAAKESNAGLPAYLAVCQAYRRLGDVQRRVGNSEAAEKSYSRALAVFTELVAPLPGDAESVRELAACHNSLGVVKGTPEALKHFKQAINLLAKPDAGKPDGAALRAELVRSYHGLARAYKGQGQRGAAQDNYRRALDIQTKLVADFPAVPRYRLDLAEIHTGISSWLEGGHWSGSTPEENSHIGKACKILDGLVQDFPDDPLYRYRLARSLSILANMAGDADQRIKDFNRSIDLLTKLRADFPRIPAYRDTLNVCYTNLGEIYWMCSDLDGAAELRRKALELSRQQAAEDSDRDYTESLGVALHNWAEVLVCRGDLAGARKHMEESVKCARAEYKARPLRTYAASEVTAANFLLYGICTALKDEAEAAKCRKEAEQIFVETWRRLAVDRGNSGAAEFCNDLAVGISYLLGYLRDKGDRRLVYCLDGATITVLAKAMELNPDSITCETQYKWALGFKRRDLAPNVPALVGGEYRPASNRERLDMAHECQSQKQYLLALTLYDAAFKAEPKSADDMASGNRSSAARTAALVGCGAGEDRLSDDDRSRWRTKARDWLRADLAVLSRSLTESQPRKAEAVKQMRRWLEDADLAGVRDAAKLAELPDAERKEWEAFWSDVGMQVTDAPNAK
jgi:tetratricopeptide (TPR) repeat protein